MIKNMLIALLVISIAGVGLYAFHEHQKVVGLIAASSKSQSALTHMPPAGPNAKGAGKPIILSKGMNLKQTPLFKFAYQMAPGALTPSAKQALVGWTVASQTQSDGSTVITLTPKDSDDQNQQYTIKQGQTLYFIEQTPVDDKADADTDLNYRDDYGIIVDQTGIVQ